MSTTVTLKPLELNFIDQTLLSLALEEDFGFPWKDLTTTALFTNSQAYHANIISKHSDPIIICGLPLAGALIMKFDNHCQIESHYKDGQILNPGETLLTLHGKAKTLLMLERILLNFLRHLSAIATLTHCYVSKIQHTSLKILDTRKTTPGFRHLEKYAVNCGGGVNHRMGLYDAIMIKDTHIDLLGGITNALAQLPEKFNKTPVIVEVRSLEELQQVLKNGKKKVTRVLLDNMTPSQISECVQLCQNIFETEASGNINLDTIVSVAETGVDYASIGRLTYDAGHVDLSMHCY